MERRRGHPAVRRNSGPAESPSSRREAGPCGGYRKLFELRRVLSRTVDRPMGHVPCFTRVRPAADPERCPRSSARRALDLPRTGFLGVGLGSSRNDPGGLPSREFARRSHRRGLRSCSHRRRPLRSLRSFARSERGRAANPAGQHCLLPTTENRRGRRWHSRPGDNVAAVRRAW